MPKTTEVTALLKTPTGIYMTVKETTYHNVLVRLFKGKEKSSRRVVYCTRNGIQWFQSPKMTPVSQDRGHELWRLLIMNKDNV